MSVVLIAAEVPVLECEIDSHLSETNQYFQKTGFVLDDLHVYAEPFAKLHRTIMNDAEGFIRPLTDKQVLAMYRKGVKNIKAVHASMEMETEQRQAAD